MLEQLSVQKINARSDLWTVKDYGTVHTDGLLDDELFEVYTWCMAHAREILENFYAASPARHMPTRYVNDPQLFVATAHPRTARIVCRMFDRRLCFGCGKALSATQTIFECYCPDCVEKGNRSKVHYSLVSQAFNTSGREFPLMLATRSKLIDARGVVAPVSPPSRSPRVVLTYKTNYLPNNSIMWDGSFTTTTTNTDAWDAYTYAIRTNDRAHTGV